MLRFNNLSIGTKLGITSGIGVLLVVGMIGALVYGNSEVKTTTEAANHQHDLIETSGLMKASVRGMQIGVRDVRLARSPDDLKKANDYLDARTKAADEYVEQLLKLVQTPENRERAITIKSLVGQYRDGTKEIAALKTQIFAAEEVQAAGGASASEATTRIGQLNDQAVSIARGKTLPIAATLETTIQAIVDLAKKHAATATAAAASRWTIR